MEKEERTPFGKRLFESREAAGLKQAFAAEQVGMSQGTLAEAEISGKRSGYTAQLARLYEVDAGWLATGKGKPKKGPDVTPGPNIRGKVPLASWVQAGDFTAINEQSYVSDDTEWIETTVPIQARTFALRVKNDSMEPDFPEGTVLIVEPDLQPNIGDFVVARNGDSEATFKQLVQDGGDLYLKPLNQRYPLKKIEPGYELVGVVRAAERRFR